MLLRSTLALALLATAASAQSPAPAAPAPSVDPAKVVWLEKMVKYLQGEVTALRAQVKKLEAATGGGGAGREGGPKSIEGRLADLQKKYEGHTHEYLLEGRAGDGSIQAVTQDRFQGAGLNSTGGARVGRVINH